MRRRRGGGLVKHAISALLAEVSENRAQLEQRDHVLFEAMSQGVLCLDNRAQILLMNTAAQTMLGLTWVEIESYDSAALETRLMPIQADGTPFPAEAYPVRMALRTREVISNVVMGILNQHELAYRWINVNAIPLFRPGELEPYQVIAILQDQTELVRLHETLKTIQAMSEERDQALVALKETQVELERVNADKSDFVAMMNNEFRSALLAMQGASETIRDGDLCIEEAREFAVDIYADALHLLHMIADQLTLSCLGTRHQRLQQGWLDLNAIITDVVNRLRPTTHHLLRLQLARALPILMGDQEKLTSIVSHLLKNAIQYSPDGGEICVSSMVEGHMVHVCVRDQGVGIAVFELERLFANLTDSAIETIERRTQGLSTIREIVQMHGGELWAESSLGTGSTFHFTIPFTERTF